MSGDRRPLSPGFCGTCRTTRKGGGLPEGECIPPGITHDLVLLIDLPARRMEREERLLAMNRGDVNKTLFDICREGGGNDARFLLAHGADANLSFYAWVGIERAAHGGHLAVVEALLDAGANELGDALVKAAAQDYTAIVSLLLDRGADVHYRGGWPLYCAAHQGHMQTAMLLLDGSRRRSQRSSSGHARNGSEGGERQRSPRDSRAAAGTRRHR